MGWQGNTCERQRGRFHPMNPKHGTIPQHEAIGLTLCLSLNPKMNTEEKNMELLFIINSNLCNF